jgi:quercetin dioxygenase-like cupin family protein
MTTARLLVIGTALASALALSACSSSTQAAPEPIISTSAVAAPGSEPVTISPAASRDETPGPAEYFTGSVSVKPLYSPNPASTGGASQVTFEPGARTAWHTHPAGQRLIITAGNGWVQEWGGERRSVSTGDVVWFAPGVKHWHGATSTEAMTHIAVHDTIDGSNAGWLEQVTDAQYEGR